MRMRPALLATALLGALALGGCGGDEPTLIQGDAPSQAPQTPDQEDGGQDGGGQDGGQGGGSQGDKQLGSGDPDTCEQVRAGIDAFNEQDYDETVSRFEDAVPLAEAAAQDADDQEAADLLLEAVRYYAELAPDDYPAAAISSREFLAYKAITLGQCYDVDNPQQSPQGTEPPGVLT